MNNTLLIVGDPRGNHSLAAIRKYPAEAITVWEHPDNFYTIKQIDSRINVTTDLQELVDKDMHFDVVIGNPPYDNGMYRDFLAKIPDLLDENGRFDLLFPVYTFTRKRCIEILKSSLKIDTVDMVAGHHFKDVIRGAWVIRLRGCLGKTDTFKIIFPNGETIEHRTLDDINPSSAKFIEHVCKTRDDIDPLSVHDYTISQKILNSSNKLIKHKDSIISDNNIVYLHPSLHQMSHKKQSRYPGAFSLRGFYNTQNDKTKNGFYQVTESPEQSEVMYNILCESKLFVYLYWIIASDSLYTDGFIKMLPDVTNMTYKNESDLYEQFELTSGEIERIESIFP